MKFLYRYYLLTEMRTRVVPVSTIPVIDSEIIVSLEEIGGSESIPPNDSDESQANPNTSTCESWLERNLELEGDSHRDTQAYIRCVKP